MGNYLTVKCSNCEKEVTAEFREDLLQPQMIEIEGCQSCGYDEGHTDGEYDGKREAYSAAIDALREARGEV